MMKASDIPELDTRGLREFGLTTGAILVVLFGGVFPYVFDRPWPVWPWIVFAILALWAIVAPNTLKPLYHGWMRLGLLLGKVTTPIIMTLVFAITIVPMALALRLLRRDFMRRKFDDSPSYRVKSRPPSVENMEKPY
jgi:amino acid transporter